MPGLGFTPQTMPPGGLGGWVQKEPEENVWKFDVEKPEIYIGYIWLMKFDVLISWYFASASAIDSYKGKTQIALLVCVCVFSSIKALPTIWKTELRCCSGLFFLKEFHSVTTWWVAQSHLVSWCLGRLVALPIARQLWLSDQRLRVFSSVGGCRMEPCPVVVVLQTLGPFCSLESRSEEGRWHLKDPHENKETWNYVKLNVNEEQHSMFFVSVVIVNVKLKAITQDMWSAKPSKKEETHLPTHIFLGAKWLLNTSD